MIDKSFTVTESHTSFHRSHTHLGGKSQPQYLTKYQEHHQQVHLHQGTSSGISLKGLGVRRKKGTTCCWQPRTWRLISELIPRWRWTCWCCSWYLVRYWGWDLPPVCVCVICDCERVCVTQWLWKTCLSFKQWSIKRWLHSFFLYRVSHKVEFYLERFLMRQHCTKQLVLVIFVIHWL